MDVLQIILVFVVLLSALPLGMLLARSTKEELQSGRDAFFAIMVGCGVITIASLFLKIGINEKLLLIFCSAFIYMVTQISYSKTSYNEENSAGKKKTRKK
jgi:FtsH-binding integral membrane protein